MGKQALKQLCHSISRAGIVEAGRDFIERNEDEGPLGEVRMGDLEIEFAEDEIVVEKKVEVESAGAVGNAGRTVAAEFALDGEQGMEKLIRDETGFERDNGVEEARLIGEPDGRGGVERGARCDAAKGGEARGGRGERGFGRAGGAGQVGAEERCRRGALFPKSRGKRIERI